MNRNVPLKYLILQIIRDGGDIEVDRRTRDYTQTQINYTVWQLEQGGMIERRNGSLFCLTWDGHEMLDRHESPSGMTVYDVVMGQKKP